MTSGRQSFYITTPIYYPIDVPHIGHGYTTVAVDTLARWHRQAGDDTWMLTGTDEHGQKMLRAASANGVTPQEWVDKLVTEAWFPLLKTLDVDRDWESDAQHRFVQAKASTSVQVLESRAQTVQGERVNVALMVATETTGEDPWVTAPRTERPMTVVVDTTQNRVVEQIDMTPHGGL